MRKKTSSTEFKKYGEVYHSPILYDISQMVAKQWQISAERNVSKLQIFDCECYIEIQSGLGAIIIRDLDDGNIYRFDVHRYICLKPGIPFALVAITSEIETKLVTKVSYSSESLMLPKPYSVDRILPNIKITQILGYYYSVRNTEYRFKGEAHSYYELTYVDRGNLTTCVDGTQYILQENNLMIYGAQQFHTQMVAKSSGDHKGSCSYITILFEMDEIKDNTLLNRVFVCDRLLQETIRRIVQENSTQLPYMNSLMLCLLQEAIIRLLQNDFLGGPSTRQPVSIHRHYQDELLEKILEYIDENIRQPVTVAEICKKFSLSRSSLQILFKENLNQTPKKYISEKKMQESKRMINEGKHTISEIALTMGFNSIHYFSRSFTQRFNMSPSEYIKTIYKE